MKIIFLDFDGVLNSYAYFKRNKHKSRTNSLGEAGALDPAAVARLNRLVESTGAEIVVSSTWRLGYSREGLEEILRKRGFKYAVRDVTPHLLEWREDDGGRIQVCRERGDEILTWLAGTTDVETFVVLDDNSDMSAVADRFVQTEMDEGLTDAKVDRCIEMLNLATPCTEDTAPCSPGLADRSRREGSRTAEGPQT